MTTATRKSAEADDEIAELALSLRRELGARIRELRLVACEEGLVLQGRTHSFYLKQLAQVCVMRSTLLPIRANEIVVTCRGPGEPADETFP